MNHGKNKIATGKAIVETKPQEDGFDLNLVGGTIQKVRLSLMCFDGLPQCCRVLL